AKGKIVYAVVPTQEGLLLLLFSVGRSLSSSPDCPLPASGLEPPRRRSVGRPLSVPLLILRRFSIWARRAFTSSNSEVSTLYSSRGGRSVLISRCDFWIRSGVCGWVWNALAKIPGRSFSKVFTFSKNAVKACGSYPALYMYSTPR